MLQYRLGDVIAYIVGLVNSPEHAIADPTTAARQLYCMDETESQEVIETPRDLLRAQKLFLLQGYFPQTPVMITRAWSPISSLLERGFEPFVLDRIFNGGNAVATGIWPAFTVVNAKPIAFCNTDEDLFWAIAGEVSDRARKRKHHINIIAHPGWSYESAVESLQEWDDAEIEKADRVLWKKTPDG